MRLLVLITAPLGVLSGSMMLFTHPEMPSDMAHPMLITMLLMTLNFAYFAKKRP